MERQNDVPSIREQIRNSEARLHLLIALAKVLEDPQACLQIVLEAQDPEAACQSLRAQYGFDEVQAQVVLDLQFRRTTRRDRGRMSRDRDEVAAQLRDLRSQLPDAAD